jgi:hypothetical protein
MSNQPIEVRVQQGDVLQIEADVLALKYAQAYYGVDAVAARKLSSEGRKLRLPKPWKHILEKSAGGIAAQRVLFMGVPELHLFGYGEIREFARAVLSALAADAPESTDLALTVHGPGYGLDEAEAFAAEIGGLLDGVRSGDLPDSLRKITVVELDAALARRLQNLLSKLLPGGVIEPKSAKGSTKAMQQLRSAGAASSAKPRVFVAMPFKDEMLDSWNLGIYPAVRAAGFVCERADLESFVGDVVDWVRTRIKTSTYVVALLTDANPNVYLEVGYAWGVGVPTVLLVSDPDHLKFDAKGQRSLVYKNITELKSKLRKELKQLATNAATPTGRAGGAPLLSSS